MYMFIRISVEQTEHVRTSKLGIEHSYRRRKTTVHFRCD